VLPKPSLKVVILAGVWLVLFSFFTYGLLYASIFVTNFHKTHPDDTLKIEDVVISFFEKITLPIKLAKLAREEPDKELLMPIIDLKVSDIGDTWGAPRGENGERKHEGQDIFAPRGTPVFSATNGYVTRIISEKLGGNSVYVTGKGGIDYFYTHLDRFPKGLTVGDAVTTDTVIGFVGNTGNAETTPYHLHFGVYISRDEAIDPLPLMVDR